MNNQTHSHWRVTFALIIAITTMGVQAGSAWAADSGQQNKLALLVGIDDYRYSDGKYITDLKGGSGNDVRIMRQLLVESFGFPDKAKRIRGKELPPGTPSRAVKRQHYWPDPVLRVHFLGIERSGTLRGIKAELAKFRHIQETPTPAGYRLLLREENGFIITESGDATRISPPVAISDRDAVPHVVAQVTHWAKWFNILAIENPRAGIDIDIMPMRGNRPGRSANPDNRSTFTEGEDLIIEITNRSSHNIYPALLYLSGDGSVGVVLPLQGEKEFIAPGKTWRSSEQGIQVRPTVPHGATHVRDVLKLFATTRTADFEFLRQGAVRGGLALEKTRGRARDPLEELLAGAAQGRTRSEKRVDPGIWTTAERIIEVHNHASD